MAPKQVIWNLKASEERWQKLRTNIQRNVENVRMIMSDTSVDITTRYRKYDKMLYKALISSIGKTTIRMSGQPRPSAIIKRLLKERRERKREFETATSPREKGIKLQLYKDKQAEVNVQAGR